MSKELLKHNKLGNRQELSFFLFDLLSESYQSVSSLKKYSRSQLFSILGSFEGILALLEYCSLITIQEDRVKINESNFRSSKWDKINYFEQFHFYECLFTAFHSNNLLLDFISRESLKYNVSKHQYYLLEERLPFRYFPIRNLLMSLGFLERDKKVGSKLWINKSYNQLIYDRIVKTISLAQKKSKRDVIQLKQKIKNQEEAGKRAELFVVSFEKQRLKGHPNLESIQRISEDHVNAGFDIESFESNDSVFVDRFIEVKSFTGEVNFYWSRNEIEMAEILGEKYYLYLVDRSKTDNQDYTPKMIQNPYVKIFESDVWKKAAESWKVTIES